MPVWAEILNLVQGRVVGIPADAIQFKFSPETSVAIILKRSPVIVDTGCGANHWIRLQLPFTVRGGIKLFPGAKLERCRTSVDFDEVVVRCRGLGGYVRKLHTASIVYGLPFGGPYGDEDIVVERRGPRPSVFVSEDVPVKPEYERRFFDAVQSKLSGDAWKGWYTEGFLPFRVEGREARPVNEDPELYFVTFTHRLSSRSCSASIQVLEHPGIAVWQGRTACAVDSVAAVAMLVPREGGVFRVRLGKGRYRGECWEEEREYRVVISGGEARFEEGAVVVPEEVV